MQLASYLEGRPLMWMMLLHLHANVNANDNDDDDDDDDDDDHVRITSHCFLGITNTFGE